MGTVRLLVFIMVANSVNCFGMDDQRPHNGSVVSSDSNPRTVAGKFSPDEERQPLISPGNRSDEYSLTIQPGNNPEPCVRKYEIRSDISKKVFILGILNNLWKIGAAGTFAWYVFYEQAGQGS